MLEINFSLLSANQNWVFKISKYIAKISKVRKQIQAIKVNIDRLDNKQISFQDWKILMILNSLILMVIWKVMRLYPAICNILIIFHWLHFQLILTSNLWERHLAKKTRSDFDWLKFFKHSFRQAWEPSPTFWRQNWSVFPWWLASVISRSLENAFKLFWNIPAFFGTVVLRHYWTPP